ncbi:MAG: hypothetical protein JWN34_4399 [Bryobacterales bacterium]|nr:hypothetical protein [Bryobacterales bacterium]
MPDRSEAQSLADRIRTLRAELSDPEVSRILQLTDEQQRRFHAWAEQSLTGLERDFDVDTTVTQASLSWGMRLAATLGGVALSAALILLFERYWGNFETWMQVVCVMALPLLCLAGAEYASKRERTLYFAGLLSLMSLAAFVLNLYIVGQVFNVTPSEGALLAWGSYALALAWRYGQRFILVLGLLLLISYGCAALTASFGYYWLDFYARPEHAALIAALVWGAPRYLRRPSFAPVYRATGAIVFFLAITALAEGRPVTYLPFDLKTVQTVYETLGLLLAGGLVWLGIRRRWDIQVSIGAIAFSTFLLFRFHSWWWDLMPAWLFFAIVGSIGVGLLAALKIIRRRT